MKKLLLAASAVLTTVMLGGCAQNYGQMEKITIVGEPVTLQKSGNMYIVPSNAVMARNGYYYVKINNRERVCYPQAQPNLARLNLLIVDVNVGGTTTRWDCYDINRDYFVIQR